MVERLRVAIGLRCGAIITALKGCKTIRRACSSVRGSFVSGDCLRACHGLYPRAEGAKARRKCKMQHLT